MRARWLLLLVSSACASLTGLDALHVDDAGFDVDAALDVADDSTADASPNESDASDASDAHPNDAGDATSTGPKGIACGDAATCSGQSPVCCVTLAQTTTYKCVASSSDCSGSFEIPVSCGSNTDCKLGLTCCGFPNGMPDPNPQCLGFEAASKVDCELGCNVDAGDFQVGCSVQLQNCTDTSKTCALSQCTLPGFTLCK